MNIFKFTSAGHNFTGLELKNFQCRKNPDHNNKILSLPQIPFAFMFIFTSITNFAVVFHTYESINSHWQLYIVVKAYIWVCQEPSHLTKKGKVLRKHLTFQTFLTFPKQSEYAEPPLLLLKRDSSNNRKLQIAQNTVWAAVGFPWSVQKQ